MLSQLFVLSARGDTIVHRDCIRHPPDGLLHHDRSDVPRSSTEIFFKKIQAMKGNAPPAFNVDDVQYVHIKRNALYFVATSKFNVSPTFVVEFLQRVSSIIKDYCGVLNEESMRTNFVLVYELLDELLDFGYVQTASTDQLKAFVYNEPIVVDDGNASGGLLGFGRSDRTTVPTSAANKPVASKQRSGKNEVFVDLIERITLLVGPNGATVRCDVDGSLTMKSFLAGTPELRLGFNHDLVIGRAAASARGYSSESYGAVVLDDCTFHSTVDLSHFESERALSITPPEGEFTVMSYRMSGSGVVLPFKLSTFMEPVGANRLDIVVKLRCEMPAGAGAPVAVRIPTPKSALSVSTELIAGGGQTVEVKDVASGALGASGASGASGALPARDGVKTVVWNVRRAVGGGEYALRIKLGVADAASPSVRRDIGPISIEFNAPMYLASGLSIRFLRVIDRGRSYVPYRWVRYLTASDSYVWRIV